jgi:hypothetical protein
VILHATHLTPYALKPPPPHSSLFDDANNIWRRPRLQHIVLGHPQAMFLLQSGRDFMCLWSLIILWLFKVLSYIICLHTVLQMTP